MKFTRLILRMIAWYQDDIVEYLRHTLYIKIFLYMCFACLILFLDLVLLSCAHDISWWATKRWFFFLQKYKATDIHWLNKTTYMYSSAKWLVKIPEWTITNAKRTFIDIQNEWSPLQRTKTVVNTKRNRYSLN